MGWQGIKRENDTKYTILEFLNEKKKAGFSEIADYCSKKGISRMTVKKYLDKIKGKGLVSQSLKGRHPYNITKKGIEYIRQEILRMEINKELNNMSLQELKLFNDILVERWLSKAVIVHKRDKRIYMFLLGSPLPYKGSLAPVILDRFCKPPDELPAIEEAFKIIEEHQEKFVKENKKATKN